MCTSDILTTIPVHTDLFSSVLSTADRAGEDFCLLYLVLPLDIQQKQHLHTQFLLHRYRMHMHVSTETSVYYPRVH